MFANETCPVLEAHPPADNSDVNRGTAKGEEKAGLPPPDDEQTPRNRTRNLTHITDVDRPKREANMTSTEHDTASTKGRGIVRRAAAIGSLLALAAAATLAGSAPANATSVGYTEQAYVNSAAAYASSHGYSTGIAVYDTATGAFYGAGHYDTYYASESVVKAFIATEILLKGDMHGSTASTAYKMITQSDDNSANRLYGLAGGDSVVSRLDSHYGIHIGHGPSRSGWWGNTYITAKGMVQFYAKVRKDSKVWPWLYNAMRHATKYGSDGYYQYFGIPSASKQGWAVKQGWGEDDNCFCHSTWDSTGFVDNGRYAIAILTAGPGYTYNSPISHMVTSEAQRMMPGGKIIDPASRNPRIGIEALYMYHGKVYLKVYAVDPDSTQTRLYVIMQMYSKYPARGYTNYGSPGVDKSYHSPGVPHDIRFFLTPESKGLHEVCAWARNVGAGTSEYSKVCGHVTVT